MDSKARMLAKAHMAGQRGVGILPSYLVRVIIAYTVKGKVSHDCKSYHI
jgi:hypothetical protein